MPSTLLADRADEDVQAPPKTRSSLWLVFLGLAVVEIVGHFVLRARVVDEEEWHRAAALVRREWRSGDLIVASPGWSDPIVRAELGDLIELEDAGRSDIAQYERLWTLSIRGFRPEEAPDHAPELDRQIGPVRVLRWDLTPDAVLYDFTEHVPEARVVLAEGAVETPCRWERNGRPSGGGLGAGPITPAYRHACDPRRSWLWVGTTIQDDLDLRPRYCIWQHPAAGQTVRATFPSVPLGERLVLYGDIYYEHERWIDPEPHNAHAPVHVSVRVDGVEIGRMIHNDGDAWKRLIASTRMPNRTRDRGDVSIEVTSPDPNLRTFCWSATTRGPEAR
jgi:hypothetical protein